jgi:hypothetical protein
MARGVLGSPASTVWFLALVAAGGCKEGASIGDPPAPPAVEEAAPPCEGEVCAKSEVACVGSGCARAAAEGCGEMVVVFRDGKTDGAVCVDRAAELGLTVVDLADDWVPRVLRGGGEAGPVGYAERYRQIAAEVLGDDDTWDRENLDRYFELYGIFPTLSVVAMRLGDEARHRCHDGVERGALEALEEGVDTWRSLADQRSDAYRAGTLERQLEAVREAQGLASTAELASDPVHGSWLSLVNRLATRGGAVEAMQAHLRCEGFLGPAAGRPGLIDSDTISAMFLYHRRHMVVSWQLDAATRDVMLTDSRELDFRTALRVLRERVADATGLIEDGTAGGARAPVVDRVIDTPVFHQAEGSDGAPDLLGLATDAAARALGWLTPEATRDALVADLPAAVALPLPAPPPYHGPHMDLRVEIDRGDVWYDFPFVPNGDRMVQPRERLPATTLYVVHEGSRLDLVRWPTTIGGWHPEDMGDGSKRLVYKESPPGSVIWRDLVAAPRWIPPRSTPTRDLVRPRRGGGWAARHDTFGPHYASAYGLAMLVHHRVDTPPDGESFLTDQGIRSHGSVSYDTILDGFSHGCHRLHNHRAVRLAGFLLAHRDHRVRGDVPLDFHRQLVWRGKRFNLAFDTRGYHYELTPPVEVEVLAGTSRGWAKAPRPPQRLTRPMLKRYR